MTSARLVPSFCHMYKRCVGVCLEYGLDFLRPRCRRTPTQPISLDWDCLSPSLSLSVSVGLSISIQRPRKVDEEEFEFPPQTAALWANLLFTKQPTTLTEYWLGIAAVKSDNLCWWSVRATYMCTARRKKVGCYKCHRSTRHEKYDTAEF